MKTQPESMKHYDEAKALSEGWLVSTTSRGTLEVQRVDDPEALPEGAPYLSGDYEALWYARRMGLLVDDFNVVYA